MKTHHSFEHENVSEALPSLLTYLMSDGEEVGSRQGERTQEILMPRIALWKPWQREVLVPGRKASIAAQIAETMWVLAGRNDVEWLSHYLPRAGDFSDDGLTWRGGYGPRLRSWGGPATYGSGIHSDQLANVVRLLNDERGTRRAVMAIYDPVIDSVGGKDVPCNDFLTFISRGGKLHVSVTTRSNDVIWGWSGINQFEWSALQEIVAYLTGNQVGTLTFNITSLHVYEKHWDKARQIVKRSGESPPYIPFEPKDSPRFEPLMTSVEHLDELIKSWFRVEELIRNGNPSNALVDQFNEPMLKSWLQVIQWYWSPGKSQDPEIKSLIGSRLHMAVQMSPSRGQVLRRPDEPRPGDIQIPGTFPVSNDGTINADFPPPVKVGPVIPITPQMIDDLRDSVLTDRYSTRDKVLPLLWTTQFVEYVDNLHREKSAVYGDSWKRRGEQISILANVARKVDRLGVGGAGDSSADTVIDLLVYLVKYRLWINEHMEPEPGQRNPELEADAVRAILDVEDRTCPKVIQRASVNGRIVGLKEFFEGLSQTVKPMTDFGDYLIRANMVDQMIRLAFPLARLLWGEENGHILSPAAAGELLGAAVTNATRRWEGYEVGENID
jgi:thymidylate synthase